MTIFFLFPSKKFLPISFKIQLLETSPPKQKEQRQKQLDVYIFWCLLPSCTFWILCFLLLLFTFCQVCLLVKETAEMAEKSCRDQAYIRQKLGLVWRNRKKINQIIKDYFYLPFFLLIISCASPSARSHLQISSHPNILPLLAEINTEPYMCGNLGVLLSRLAFVLFSYTFCIIGQVVLRFSRPFNLWDTYTDSWRLFLINAEKNEFYHIMDITIFNYVIKPTVHCYYEEREMKIHTKI